MILFHLHGSLDVQNSKSFTVSIDVWKKGAGEVVGEGMRNG